MRFKVSLSILLTALVVSVGVLGFIIGRGNVEVRTQTQYVDVPIETTIVKEVPVTQTIERIVEVPVIQTVEVVKPQAKVLPGPFASIDQLQTWVNTNFGVICVAGPSGSVDFNSPTNDICVLYSERLQQLALLDGYSLNLAVFQNGEIYGHKVNNLTVGHMGDLAIINGVGYYVEPQTKEITKLWDNQVPSYSGY